MQLLHIVAFRRNRVSMLQELLTHSSLCFEFVELTLKLDRQLGETDNQYQQGIGMASNNGQSAIQHENAYNSSSHIAENLVGALGGLFNPAPNYADENAEAAFQRKLKKKKKRRISW